MKIHLRLADQPQKSFFRILESMGFGIFLLTFWMSGGFFLGGNPVFLGPYFPSLEIVFPWCGIGILLLFFGKFFSGNLRALGRKEVLFVLLFLGFSALSALFSLDSQSSVLYLILWTVGFLALGFDDAFLLRGRRNRILLLISILLGFAFLHAFPSWSISSDVLSFGAFLGIVFAYLESSFRERILLICLYGFILAQTGSFFLLLFAIGLLLFAKFWIPFYRTSIHKKEILLPLFWFLVLLGWGIVSGWFEISFHWGWISGVWDTFTHAFFGIGEGQYVRALQELSPVILTPDQFQLPTSGFLLTLIEKGIGGFLFLLALLSVRSILQRQVPIILPILIGMFLVFTPDLITAENGILTMLVFAFVTEEKSGRFSNQI